MSEQRVAIIAGGASGIGLATGTRLAGDGTAVALLDQNAEGAAVGAAKIEADGRTAIGLGVDVTDRAGVAAAVEKVCAQLGRPTILVNSAGIASFDRFLEIDVEQWNRILAVNLTSMFHTCQLVLPHMLDAHWGRIVNVSSSLAHGGSPLMTHYVASKTGVVGFTKALALEFAPAGITVNSIAPGFIDTPLLRQSEQSGFFSIDKSTGETPVGRAGQPEDIAAMCAFLVSAEASYVTGQLLGVNGGRHT